MIKQNPIEINITQKLGQILEIGEDKLREELGALWENQVPKDESHIPWIKSMEENFNSNGGILVFKLGEEVFNGGL